MPDLPARLRRTLANDSSWRRIARRAQRCFEPELAYGRHHGPAPSNAKQAAVIALLYPSPSGWTIPLTRRTEHLPDHPGQVSLPGGMLEPGEQPLIGALREWEEEMGSSADTFQLLGELSPVYVFGTNFLVTPLVATADNPPQFFPSQEEVARIIELPAAALPDRPRNRHSRTRCGLEFDVPHLNCEGEQVWGATLQILTELGSLIQSVRS